MDICLVINTCKNYFTNISELINQINTYRFPKENVLIVSAQEDENSVSYEEGIKIIKVTYTGLHQTSAIYICENIQKYSNINYWVLMPDTIKFGKAFFGRLRYYYNTHLMGKEICSLPFIHPRIRPTMDMGIVHTKHIMNMSNYLNKIKLNPPYTIDDLVKLKKQFINDENLILGLTPADKNMATRFHYIYNRPNPTVCITNKRNELIETRIGDQKNINQVYFVLLDLYKFQRNFNGHGSNYVMEL